MAAPAAKKSTSKKAASDVAPKPVKAPEMKTYLVTINEDDYRSDPTYRTRAFDAAEATTKCVEFHKANAKVKDVDSIRTAEDENDDAVYVP